jgi:hypothetical protein
MHATQVLHNYLGKMCQAIHKTRLQATMIGVRALMHGKTLSVTGIGRAIQGSAFTKHAIKRADRLIGNPALHQDRLHIYRALIQWLLGRLHRPVILVDWSELTDDRQFHILRASTPVGGRALTLYEEVHPGKKLNTTPVQTGFLQSLNALLPASCQPIIVTDAGFHTPWFNAVMQLGWHFVGRIGGQTMIRPAGTDDWYRVERVFDTATEKVRCLGRVDLVRRNPLRCSAYLLKRKPKGRVKKTRFGEKCQAKHSLKNADRERTPWLIVTSLPGGERINQQVIQLYRSRMQIEEAFRDTKNHRWGYALDDSRTTMAYRFENLLLIGMMATWATWLIGKIAQSKQWHWRYQANTVKTRNVLSLFFLGGEIVKRVTTQFTRHEYLHALKSVRNDLRVTACFG